MATMEDSRTVSPPKQRRSRKTCHRCHTRKTRCDVQQHGVPCTSCAQQSHSCVVRRRKNQRAPTGRTSEQDLSIRTSARDWALERPASVWPENTVTTFPDNHEHVSNRSQPEEPLDKRSVGGNGFDFAALADMDEIFNLTFDTVLPFIAPQVLPLQEGIEQFNLGIGEDGCAIVRASSLDLAHQQFLYHRGCLTLPSATILRRMMELYFNYVHPNLPIIDETKVWDLWTGDNFEPGNFSYLLLRAMVFAVAHFLEPEDLSRIGYVSKRDARQAYYTQAKVVLLIILRCSPLTVVQLLFDFAIESDPVANAQACLLLTYYAPNYNVLRVNSHWLVKAIQYATIAKANFFCLIEDPDRARVLKRLWWGVLFRDRILSLGLRQPMHVELDSLLSDDRHILRAGDFQHELGKSQLHSLDTQLSHIEIATATCRFIQCLTPALTILYRYERIDQRVTTASNSVCQISRDIYRCLEALRSWHTDVIGSFPSPVTLDDTSSSVCVLANMLFCYHATAVFALHAHCILLLETVPSSKPLISFDDAAKALEPAMDDLSIRVQELLQVRLAKFLPISASAIIALPLILQAINVTGARGFRMQEKMETRKLEIFTRTLESQRLHFDGADTIADTLKNIMASAKDDKLLTSMTEWREGRDTSLKRSNNKVSFQWPELARKRPRLFLRLIFKLDATLCNGTIPGEDGYPAQLRRASM